MQHELQIEAGKNNSIRNNISLVVSAVNSGVRSLEELCTITGLRPNTILRYNKEYSLDLPELEPYRYWPDIDRMIDRGLSLSDMKKFLDNNGVNITLEGIRQYIINSGQHKIWRENRTERLPVLENILSLIERRIEDLIHQSDWPYQKAFEYINSRNYTTYSIDLLVALFRYYEETEYENKKISLSKLGIPFNLIAPAVGRIFKTVGVKPLFGNKKKRQVSRYDTEAVLRSAKLPIASVDTAYFISRSRHYVSETMRRLDIKKTRYKFPIEVNKRVTYRTASQVYEARDILEANEGEIAFLLDEKESVISDTLKYREIIEPKLIHILRILHTNKSIDKPYL